MGTLKQLAPDGWTCDVCGSKRPDDRIGVATHAHTDANGVTVHMNVKYCTDRAMCRKTAAVRSLSDLALSRATQEVHSLSMALMEFHEKLIWQRATFAFIGFLLGFWIGTVV